MNRDIPANVMRILRKEVGFVCPIPGCGSPYLAYHHFDPPWSIKKHHNPDGMIALCISHHMQADRGAFTKDQIRAMKKSTQEKRVEGAFLWKRDRMIVACGGNFFFRTNVILAGNGHPFLWQETDADGITLINMSVIGTKGKELFSIRNNAWRCHTRLDDVICAASGHRIKLASKSSGFGFDIHFREVNMEEFLEYYWRGLRKNNYAYIQPNTLKFADLSESHKAFIAEDPAPRNFRILTRGSMMLLCTVHGENNWPAKFILRPWSIKSGASRSEVSSGWFNGGNGIHIGAYYGNLGPFPIGMR